MNKEQEWREEFLKEFPDIDAGCDGCSANVRYRDSIYKWFFLKLHKEIEGLSRDKNKTFDSSRLNKYAGGYNQALADIKKLLQ